MARDGRGWHRESARHGLAARGIKTGRKSPAPKSQKVISSKRARAVKHLHIATGWQEHMGSKFQVRAGAESKEDLEAIFERGSDYWKKVRGVKFEKIPVKQVVETEYGKLYHVRTLSAGKGFVQDLREINEWTKKQAKKAPPVHSDDDIFELEREAKKVIPRSLPKEERARRRKRRKELKEKLARMEEDNAYHREKIEKRRGMFLKALKKLAKAAGWNPESVWLTEESNPIFHLERGISLPDKNGFIRYSAAGKKVNWKPKIPIGAIVYRDDTPAIVIGYDVEYHDPRSSFFLPMSGHMWVRNKYVLLTNRGLKKYAGKVMIDYDADDVPVEKIELGRVSWDEVRKARKDVM